MNFNWSVLLEVINSFFFFFKKRDVFRSMLRKLKNLHSFVSPPSVIELIKFKLAISNLVEVAGH